MGHGCPGYTYIRNVTPPLVIIIFLEGCFIFKLDLIIPVVNFLTQKVAITYSDVNWSYVKQKDLCDEHSEMSGNSYLADQLADLPPLLESSGQE